MGTFGGTAILAFGYVLPVGEFEELATQKPELEDWALTTYGFEEYYNASLETDYPFVNVMGLYSGVLFYADGTRTMAFAECNMRDDPEQIVRPGRRGTIPVGDRDKYITQLKQLLTWLKMDNSKIENIEPDWLLIAQCNGPM